VEGAPAPDTLLQAPELGAASGVAELYARVAAMRSAPIGKVALLGAVLPVLAPMLVVVAIKVPLKETILQLLKALIFV
jgi:hypothetical protein